MQMRYASGHRWTKNATQCDGDTDTPSHLYGQMPPVFSLHSLPTIQRNPANQTTSPTTPSNANASAKANPSTTTNEPAATENDAFAHLMHDLIKDNLLSKKQLDEAAKKIGDKAIEFVKGQMEVAESSANFLQKASNAKMLESLSGEIKKGVLDLLNSPTGELVKRKILETVKSNPEVALAAVLAGLAAGYAANVPLKLDKSFKLGKGFEAEAGGNLGKAQSMAFEKVKAGIGYTSQYFKSSVTASYEKDVFSLENMAKFGSKDINTAATVTFNTDKTLALKLDTHISMIDLSGGLQLDTSNLSLMKGFGKFSIGNSTKYIVTEVKIDQQGKIDVGGGFKFDIFPNRLSVKGSLSYGVTDKSVKAAGSANITVIPKVFSIDIYGKGSGNGQTGYGGEIGGILTFTFP